MPDSATAVLGRPRVHWRQTDSTNERARKLAIAGAPHGTLVSAAEQTAGRGRQGRTWSAPPGSSLLCSLVLRDPPALLSLIAGVAVCDALGDRARVKWPNDVVVEQPHRIPTSADGPPLSHADRCSGTVPHHPPALSKLAGILVESRPQEGWAVLGIGVNVAVRVADLPAEVRARAASLQREAHAIEPLLAELLKALTRRLAEPPDTVLEAWRELDALLGREVTWSGGRGKAAGIDQAGRLLVNKTDSSESIALDAGEVHLGWQP
jgi:BirA family transcriptional regulator, biotin operon repressor / biotin---[acetyl-CoA-carboxylase] ligase